MRSVQEVEEASVEAAPPSLAPSPMALKCVSDVASLVFSENVSRPLDQILVKPVCANVELGAQASMIEQAMRSEVYSYSEFLQFAAPAFCVWLCIEQLSRVYMNRHWSSLGASSTATAVEVRQCIVSCATVASSVAHHGAHQLPLVLARVELLEVVDEPPLLLAHRAAGLEAGDGAQRA